MFKTSVNSKNYNFGEGNIYERVNILGVGVNAVDLSTTIGIIDQWIRYGDQHYVCVTGIHGIIESQRDKKLREIHNNAGLVTPDGMPLVWLSKLTGKVDVDRVYGPDLMSTLCEHSISKGYRHYLYGGSKLTLERLYVRLKNQYTGVNIVGMFSPPYRPLSDQEDEQVIRLINEAQPNILWVGLSTPKQELWMASHLGKIHSPIMIGVGAAFDFLSGEKKQAPLWMQRSGLEWFFRLITEPRRLWRRYLVNNPLFVILILAQFLGLREYSLPPKDSAKF